MAGNDKFDTLRGLEFFHDIAHEHLQKLAELCRVVELPAHSTVFEEYQRAEDVYIIVSGQVSLAICEPEENCRQIAVVRDGELMGWSPMVGRARLSDTAVAMTAVKAVAFDGAKLLEFCEQNPVFGFEFMRRVAGVLAERLSGSRMQLLRMCGVQLPKVQIESD